MSLAHLREVKSDRPRTSTGAATAAPRKAAGPAASYCGASREPVYRTMDEATASGLELCDSCLALFRREKKSH
jgi:hypothetical protein